MEKDRITMSKKQWNRFEILSKANDGFITVQEASEALGLSERQVQRLKKKVRIEGAAGVVHKNTGKPPKSKIPDGTRAEILRLRRLPEYEKSNFMHFSEILDERHSITVSYGSLYMILAKEGIRSPKTKRRKKVHRRRARKPQAGLMLQVDATPFAWFAGDRARYSIHGAIDDATGQVTALFMCKNECLHGYFEMLRRTVSNFGIPKSIYADKHAVFQSPSARKHGLDASAPIGNTQFGRCLGELSVTLIAARSPQAKGRVERLWATLQSRLPVEFAVNGIKTVEEANAFLETYIYDFNIHFAVDPKEAGNAFGKPGVEENLDHILCVKEKRVVDAGGVFSYGGRSFKIIEDAGAVIPAKQKVEVLFSPVFGVKVAYKNLILGVLPFVPPKRKKYLPVPVDRRHIPKPAAKDHYWHTDLSMHIHNFYEYESEESYYDTIKMLEKMFLGKAR